MVERRLEPAQIVWSRAVELADPAGHHDRAIAALDLLRATRHGPSTMLHALALGRDRQRSRK
jgi:hypothetical protein